MTFQAEQFQSPALSCICHCFSKGTFVKQITGLKLIERVNSRRRLWSSVILSFQAGPFLPPVGEKEQLLLYQPRLRTLNTLSSFHDISTSSNIIRHLYTAIVIIRFNIKNITSYLNSLEAGEASQFIAYSSMFPFFSLFNHMQRLSSATVSVVFLYKYLSAQSVTWIQYNWKYSGMTYKLLDHYCRQNHNILFESWKD